MKSYAIMLVSALALALLPAMATADWIDDFDSYANGSGLIGQGGWEGWAGGVATDAYVTNLYSHSAPHSVDIRPTTDVIQQFTNINSGICLISAWMYIPSSATGEQYFILLDQYSHAGANHWALQVMFANGIVESQFDNAILPLVTNQWVLFTVQIDFESDNMVVTYDGDVLIEKPWTMGSSNLGDGILNLACLDLFSNGGASVYWDDILLDEFVTATAESSWGQIKALF